MLVHACIYFWLVVNADKYTTEHLILETMATLNYFIVRWCAVTHNWSMCITHQCNGANYVCDNYVTVEHSLNHNMYLVVITWLILYNNGIFHVSPGVCEWVAIPWYHTWDIPKGRQLVMTSVPQWAHFIVHPTTILCVFYLLYIEPHKCHVYILMYMFECVWCHCHMFCSLHSSTDWIT